MIPPRKRKAPADSESEPNHEDVGNTLVQIRCNKDNSHRERKSKRRHTVAGVIPGPKEPSPKQLNHFLMPLVEDLLLFWEGVQFSRTADYPQGRLVYAALIPVVADLPASRKVHGAPGPTATRYCALCLTKRKTNHGLDPTKWPKQTWAKWVQRANQWKNAISRHEQTSVFEKYGV